jgi:two-component system nitrate/nitrite response regulator NarL
MITTMTRPSTSLALPGIALRCADPLRARQLERDLADFPRLEPDVLVLLLPPGAALPAEAGSFDGAVLVLSDDSAIAADAALPGVLPSAAPGKQIAAAIMALAEGLTVRLPGQADRRGFAPPEAASRPLLTPRELEVLALVGEGMSNKTIARRLGISAHTVKYHLEAVFTKLAVRSRAEAVTRGLRRGLLVV